MPELKSVMCGLAEGTLKFFHEDGFEDEEGKETKVYFDYEGAPDTHRNQVIENLNTNFQQESYDMTDMCASYTNVKDINQKYIAACGGGSGKVIVWNMQHSWLDLPTASISYEGKILDIKMLQDLDRQISVLLTLHADPNCLIVTSMRDFKFVRKIPLPC